VGVTRKKVTIDALRTESQVLDDIAMSMGHPKGLLCRVAYYCIFSFGIRGGGELHRLWRADFTFGEDDKGKYICNVERYSKNYKCTLTKFQPEHFWDPVKVYDADVYETFTRYCDQLPEGMKEFFLTSIPNPRERVWYAKLVMGLKPLSGLVKQIFVENGLDPKEYSNKLGRVTLVTHMSDLGVLSEIGMKVTGKWQFIWGPFLIFSSAFGFQNLH
jgi:hypothetical protein